MSPKHTNSTPSSGSTQAQAQLIMDDVKLLFNSLSTPESNVTFDPPSRANPATIQANINPPALTWTWPNAAGRQAQSISMPDAGKYGLQTDINTLFQLTSVTPAVWQPVHITATTWTWPNLVARNAQPVTPDDLGKIGIQTDINVLYQLTCATPPVWQPVANPTNTSTPFELSTGAADADSYHDFFRLQIAFEDVWTELLDQSVPRAGEILYSMYDNLMDLTLAGDREKDRLKSFAPSLPSDVAGIDELNNFIAGLKVWLGIGGQGSTTTPAEITKLKSDLYMTLQGCNMLLHEIDRLGLGEGGWGDGQFLSDTDAGFADMAPFPGVKRGDVFNNIINSVQSINPSTQDFSFPDLAKLLTDLDGMLKEKYRFDVFCPNSINYGLLLNYRQHWQPQSYQVGNLVSTIPLAPQEVRRYTTKTVVKKTRNIKEIDDSVRGGKDESSTTWRVDSEIVNRAKNQTNFQKNASGSFGNDAIYKVSAGMSQVADQAVESAQTKREFHESVIKSAQEYRNEHRTEVTTEEVREDESTSYREIRNPNDELTVTYLFYELQRRYLVDESLHKITPVILVANEVPAPHEVDQAWLLRYDWIIKRTILDKSFLPALDYLSTNYAGEELTLQVLGLAVEQQKGVVDKISQQVMLSNDSLNSATIGLQQAENKQVQDMQNAESVALVKSIFDPLGVTQSGGDGNSDRARVDFAKDELNRAQAKVDKLLSDLKAEATALQIAIEKYTKAATQHFTMLAEIDRLRVHVKDNIIYYMQAIWTYEPADQRYFRLYDLDVPVFTHNTSVKVSDASGLAAIDKFRAPIAVAFPPPSLAGTMKLHQVADIENLIGFKGNYMIFPMTNFNYMTWFMMQDYIHFDDVSGVTAQDPDQYAALTVEQLKDAMTTVYAKDPGSFGRVQPIFQEIMLRLLSNQNPEMVIVPSNSLYIEALPGTHPLLEDYKLIHRAIDIKRAQADARHAELENLRLGARLMNSQHGDPDIDKVVVVGPGQNVTVDAGQ